YRMAEPEQPLDAIIFDPFAIPGRVTPPARRYADGERSAAPPAGPHPPGLANGNFLARVRDYERGLLAEALYKSRFNQRKAAEVLGLGYHQLRHYLKKHGLAAADRRPDQGPG
ncbi:MAG: helix-turn-helix domain-containing protein, partial [Stellaceae bacterium]